jgi:uncharacterized protein YjbI with pentapeptide repeats
MEMIPKLDLRSPTVLTAIGVVATLVLALMVVVALLLTGGAKAVSDNAALIGALVALGGVFTTQLVNSALEAQRAQQARGTQQEQWERDRETQQAQRDRELTVESQRAQDDAVQTYLDQMADLLLDEARLLRQSSEGDVVRTLARARTLTVLSRLDDWAPLASPTQGPRKGNIVLFLYESDLITHERPLVDLMGADLSHTALVSASLSGANLVRTDLSYTNLTYADLAGAFLSRADLSGAILGGADLREADLTDVTGLTEEQLRATNSLEGATMPDGQTLKSDDNPDGPTFEEWLKSKGRGEDGENSGP